MSSADPATEPVAPPRRPAPIAIVALVVVSLLIPATLLWFVTRDDAADSPDTTGLPPAGDVVVDEFIGAEAPDFTLEDLDGEPVSLSDYRGRPLVLVFWASWCIPCRKEFPLLQQTLEQYPGEFDVLGVSYDTLARDSAAFMEDVGASFTVALDPGNEVGTEYGVVGLPVTFFIDGDGVVRDRVFGGVRQQELDESLVPMLDG